MFDYLMPFSDETTECSYVPDQMARLPMSLPAGPIAPNRFDELMENGFRRSGTFYYYTSCPACNACQPIRLEISKFRPNRAQRRSRLRSDTLRYELARPTVDRRRVELFNRHRDERGLARSERPMDATSYQSFLMASPNVSVELSLWDGNHLVAISITDVGEFSLSAVYCYFDPDYAYVSPGTLCILKQVELARASKKLWLYLGYYVGSNPHLSYKANFKPHQRRVNGSWREFA